MTSFRHILIQLFPVALILGAIGFGMACGISPQPIPPGGSPEGSLDPVSENGPGMPGSGDFGGASSSSNQADSADANGKSTPSDGKGDGGSPQTPVTQDNDASVGDGGSPYAPDGGADSDAGADAGPSSDGG